MRHNRIGDILSWADIPPNRHLAKRLPMLKVARNICKHPLTKNNRLSAFSRYIKWQIGSRVIRQPIVLPLVNKTIIILENGDRGATSNWYYGLDDYAEMGFLLHYLRKEDLFMDIGANVGVYTILAAGVAGAQAVAVEPIPSTFEKLKRNIVANDITDRVSLHNLGVSHYQGELNFTTDFGAMNHVVAPHEWDASVVVPVQSADNILAGAVPQLIKIDVEGWEPAVLRGMKNTLADTRLKVIIMETNAFHNRERSIDDLYRTMHSFDFVEYNYDPATRLFHKANIESQRNTIFLRDFDFIKCRIEKAGHFETVSMRI